MSLKLFVFFSLLSSGLAIPANPLGSIHPHTSDVVVSRSVPHDDDGGSILNGPISRIEIMLRGQYWIDKHVPYSQEKYYPDPAGMKYRTDCSGFVSMALHTNHPGYNTVSLPEVAVRINWSQLQKGDFVGTLGAGTGGDDGHVVLFHSWKDSGKTTMKTLECTGSRGCVVFEREKGFAVGSKNALPYRYKHLKG